MPKFETDLERDLSELPWRRPRESLRDRIWRQSSAQDSGSLTSSAFRQRLVSLPWTVLFTISAGLGGFFVGISLQQDNTPRLARVVADVRIIETFSEQNSFDFSSQDTQILPGEFTAYIE